MDAVRCFVGTQNTWDRFCTTGKCNKVICQQTHSVLPPSKMMLGRETYQPADLLFATSKNKLPELSTDEYMRDLEKAMKHAAWSSTRNP